MSGCPECGYENLEFALSGHAEALFHCVYDESAYSSAATEIVEVTDRIASAIVGVAVDEVRQPVGEDRWSALEYACHVRDVLAYQRERVLRALRQYGDEPFLMGRNERAEHDGYRAQDPFDVATQLRHAAKLLVDVLGRLTADEWELTVNYPFPEPGARTLRWVAVHTAHEVVHHEHDIRSLSGNRQTERLTPTQVVLEFIALSVVESTYSPGLEVSVDLWGNTVVIEDSGRGMQLAPDEGDTIPHAQRALTSIYPVESASPEVDQLLSELVWGSRGSLGPSIANSNCAELQYRSRRDGEAWVQRFERGLPTGPPELVGPTTASGTTIVIRTLGRADGAAVAKVIERLTTEVSSASISLRT